MKIFYNPKTLEIRGMTDGDNSMKLPYVETSGNYHSTQALEIVKKNGKTELKVKDVTLEEIIDQNYIRMRQPKNNLK